MNIAIPFGTPPSKFAIKKNNAFENLCTNVTQKGAPKLLENVPEHTKRMVDNYLPRFLEQLLPVVDASKKQEGETFCLELGVGMKPSFALPLPPSPPLLTGAISFVVFLGVGGKHGDEGPSDPMLEDKTNENFVPTEAEELAIEEAKKGLEEAKKKMQEVEVDSKIGQAVMSVAKGALIIDVVSATGLWQSPPQVKVKVTDMNGKKLKTFKTYSVANCRNPTWNEKFMYVCPDNRDVNDLMLKLEVHDKGNLGVGVVEQTFTNIFTLIKRTDSGKPVEMTLQPKSKGDEVQGSLCFACRRPTKKDLEELADLPTKLTRALVNYIAFSFTNAIAKLRPRNARFVAEAEVNVMNSCFIFVASCEIPWGTEPDVFEAKKDKCYEQLEAVAKDTANQGKKYFAKIPGHTQELLNKILPRFMEQITPLVEASRDSSKANVQAQTGVGVKPEFALPFPPAPAVISGSLALKAIFGAGGNNTASQYRSLDFPIPKSSEEKLGENIALLRDGLEKGEEKEEKKKEEKGE